MLPIMLPKLIDKVGFPWAIRAMGLVFFVRDTGPLAYLVRFVFGIGVGALFSGYFTFCTDIVPEARRTEGIALFGISGLVPLAVNPFAEKLGVSALDVRWFLPALSLVMLSSLLFLRDIPEPAGVAKAERSGLSDTLRALRNRRLWPVWLATVAFSSLVMTFMAFASVAAQTRGLGSPASFWLTYAAGAVCVRAFGARLPDRMGTHNVVTPAIGFCIGGAALMASADSMTTLRIAGLLGGMGHGYCFPVLATQVTQRTPVAVRGSAVSAFTALFDVSGLLSPPLLGLIADRSSDAFMFAVASCSGVIALTVWAAMEHVLGGPLAPQATAVPVSYSADAAAGNSAK